MEQNLTPYGKLVVLMLIGKMILFVITSISLAMYWIKDPKPSLNGVAATVTYVAFKTQNLQWSPNQEHIKNCRMFRRFDPRLDVALDPIVKSDDMIPAMLSTASITLASVTITLFAWCWIHRKASQTSRSSKPILLLLPTGLIMILATICLGLSVRLKSAFEEMNDFLRSPFIFSVMPSLANYQFREELLNTYPNKSFAELKRPQLLAEAWIICYCCLIGVCLIMMAYWLVWHKKQEKEEKLIALKQAVEPPTYTASMFVEANPPNYTA